MTQDPITWEALEYEHVERSNDWFWAVWIIAISSAVISVILGNIIFSLVIIVSAFSLIVSAKRKPKLLQVEINRTGIIIDEDMMTYGSLRSFWVDDNSRFDGISKLYIQPKGMSAHLINIPIENVSPTNVRNFLLHQLLEEELSEPFLHHILKRLGF